MSGYFQNYAMTKNPGCKQPGFLFGRFFISLNHLFRGSIHFFEITSHQIPIIGNIVRE